METKPDNMKSRVQETLDQLLTEQLIPFALTAHRVTYTGFGQYIVSFFDSRLHSIRFTSTRGNCKTVVQTAVLEGVRKMDSLSEEFLNRLTLFGWQISNGVSARKLACATFA